MGCVEWVLHDGHLLFVVHVTASLSAALCVRACVRVILRQGCDRWGTVTGNDSGKNRAAFCKVWGLWSFTMCSA